MKKTILLITSVMTFTFLITTGYAMPPVSHSQEELNSELIRTVVRRDTNKVRTLVEEGASPDATDDTKMTALMWAAYYGPEEIALYLIEKGANIYTKNSKEIDALWVAVGNSFQNKKLINVLLDQGVIPRCTHSVSGETTLYRGLQDRETVSRLLASGADQDINRLVERARADSTKPPVRETALHNVAGGSYDVLEMLLKCAQANPWIENSDGKTPVMESGKDQESADLLWQYMLENVPENKKRKIDRELRRLS